MGKAVVLFKVYPKDGELERAMSAIKEQMKPQSMQAEDVAFGIKVIKVLFTYDDAPNASAKIEEQLRRMDGVNEVEVEEESLL